MLLPFFLFVFNFRSLLHFIFINGIVFCLTISPYFLFSPFSFFLLFLLLLPLFLVFPSTLGSPRIPFFMHFIPQIRFFLLPFIFLLYFTRPTFASPFLLLLLGILSSYSPSPESVHCIFSPLLISLCSSLSLLLLLPVTSYPTHSSPLSSFFPPALLPFFLPSLAATSAVNLTQWPR